MDPMKPMTPMAGMEPMKPMQPMATREPWWPDELGAPSTSGAQDQVRYAVFPQARRLLVEDGGRLATYDTAEYRISGVAQAQSHGRRLVFTSQDGPLDLDALKRV